MYLNIIKSIFLFDKVKFIHKFQINFLLFLISVVIRNYNLQILIPNFISFFSFTEEL